MSTTEPAVPLTDGGTESYHSGSVRPYGHPRGALRPIPRFPPSTSDIEAAKIAFGPGSSAHPLPVSGTSPVPEGGIHPVGT